MRRGCEGHLGEHVLVRDARVRRHIPGDEHFLADILASSGHYTAPPVDRWAIRGGLGIQDIGRALGLVGRAGTREGGGEVESVTGERRSTIEPTGGLGRVARGVGRVFVGLERGGGSHVTVTMGR